MFVHFLLVTSPFFFEESSCDHFLDAGPEYPRLAADSAAPASASVAVLMEVLVCLGCKRSRAWERQRRRRSSVVVPRVTAAHCELG